MWGTLLKVVAHVAVSSAVKQRMDERRGHAPTPEPGPPSPAVAASAPAERPRPGFPALALLLGTLGFCCLSTGLLSELGSTMKAIDARVEAERVQAFTSMLTGFALCIFPAIAMLAVAGPSYARHRLESRLVALVEVHPHLAVRDVATSLGTTVERARDAWREAARKGYVDGRADVIAEAPVAPVSAAANAPAPARSVAANPGPSPAGVVPVVVTPPPPGSKRWAGTCPSCRAAVEVLLYPGMRPKCPACRASLGFQV